MVVIELLFNYSSTIDSARFDYWVASRERGSENVVHSNHLDSKNGHD